MPVNNSLPNPPTGYYYGPYIVEGITRDDAPRRRTTTTSTLRANPDIIYRGDEPPSGHQNAGKTPSRSSLGRQVPSSWNGYDTRHVGAHFEGGCRRYGADDANPQDVEDELAQLELEAKRLAKKKASKNGGTERTGERQSKGGGGKR